MPMILLGKIGATGLRNGTRSPVSCNSPKGWADSSATERRPSSPSTTPNRGLPSTLSRAIRTARTLPTSVRCMSSRSPRLDDWFLGPEERGNPGTDLRPWTTGNRVDPRVHGAEYFPRLVSAVQALVAGDLLAFPDWRGDADQILVDGDPPLRLADLLGGAAERGVCVRGLVWRSHLDQVGMNERENQHVGDRTNAAGGEVLLDERVRAGGSHHQKLVVLRTDGPERESVAFVGGIDLAHNRRDDVGHAGAPQPQPMAAVYGERPPWHDVQAEVHGPAVADLEHTFRERWNDPEALDSRNPYRMLVDLRSGIHVHPQLPLPARRPDPPP